MIGRNSGIYFMLFKGSRDYKTRLKQYNGDNQKVHTLQGRYHHKYGRIECYVDNIAVGIYHRYRKENMDIINFVENNPENTVLPKDTFYRELDSDIINRSLKRLDVTLLHELTHRDSGAGHPLGYSKLIRKMFGSLSRGGKKQYGLLRDILKSEDKAKSFLLSEINMRTYTTCNFDDKLERLVDWYREE